MATPDTEKLKKMAASLGSLNDLGKDFEPLAKQLGEQVEKLSRMRVPKVSATHKATIDGTPVEAAMYDNGLVAISFTNTASAEAFIRSLK